MTYLAEAEDRLKDFKLRNLGVTDASGKDYYARMSGLTDDLAKLSVELRAAEQSRDALKRELGGESSSIIPDVPPPGATIQTPEYDARLDAKGVGWLVDPLLAIVFTRIGDRAASGLHDGLALVQA